MSKGNVVFLFPVRGDTTGHNGEDGAFKCQFCWPLPYSAHIASE